MQLFGQAGKTGWESIGRFFPGFIPSKTFMMLSIEILPLVQVVSEV